MAVNRSKHRLWAGLFLLLALGGLLWLSGTRSAWSWWLTPDQRGVQLLAQGEAAAAARVFRSPQWRALALYEAGEYLAAERLWLRRLGPVENFNLGAALAQQGRYIEAADRYRQALAARPAWAAAQQNLRLVESLGTTVASEVTDNTGAGHSADGVVFDSRRTNSDNADPVTVNGDGLSDSQRKALWLRRLDASPAQFLRLKFAHQQQRRQEQLQ